MKLNRAIQECLVSLLLLDDKAGAQVAALVPAKAYDRDYRSVAEAAASFRDAYGEAPKEHAIDLFEDLIARDADRSEVYEAIWDSVQRTISGVNTEYVLAHALAFSKLKRIKDGIATAIDLLEEETAEKVEEAEGVLIQALKPEAVTLDAGTLLNDPDQALKFIGTSLDVFPTGIRALDRRGIGPARKTLMLLGAPAKKGKTWACIQMAKAAMIHGLKPAIASLELSEDKYAMRLMQAFFSISKRRMKVIQTTRFEKDENGRFMSFDFRDVVDRPSLSDGDIEAVLRKKITNRLKNRPPCIVKEFPTGRLTVRQLEAWLDRLESTRGFIPDLLIVDYPDLMRIEKIDKKREYLGQIYVDLRGLLVARNIAGFAVTQQNREGSRKSTSDGTDVSEDWSKIGTVDLFCTLNQTIEEKKLGLMRWFVSEGRDEADKFTVLLSQAFALGQFCLDSAVMSGDYWSEVNAESDDEFIEDGDD